MNETVDTCKRGHPRTPENMAIRSKGAGRRSVTCKVCNRDRERELRARRREKRDAERDAAGLHQIKRGLSESGKIVRWRRQGWFDPYGRAYATVEAIEYERANEDSFRLAARRALVRFLNENGLEAPAERGWWEACEMQKRDWATGLPMTFTIRTIAPVIEVTAAA